MDVTPELIEIANQARRRAMARTTIRKVEYPGTSAVWQIITVSDDSGISYLHDGVSRDANVRFFTTERFARNAFDHIIMWHVLTAVANHLVKAQSGKPSQTDGIPGERG